MRKIFTGLSCLLIIVITQAQESAHSKRVQAFNVHKQEPAIGGYDPVNYFLHNTAVKGISQFTYVYQGIVYSFASSENLSTFKRQPEKYEPQYGGWCAYAMAADGSKVEVDPETFRIYDGKLYLFYNRFFNNTLKSWLKAEAVLKQKADANWPKHYKP